MINFKLSSDELLKKDAALSAAKSTKKSIGKNVANFDDNIAKNIAKNVAENIAKNVDCYVVFLDSDFKKSGYNKEILDKIEKNYFPNLYKFLELKNFNGEEKNILLTHAFDGKEVFQIMFVGLGKRKFSIDQLLEMEIESDFGPKSMHDFENLPENLLKNLDASLKLADAKKGKGKKTGEQNLFAGLLDLENFRRALGLIIRVAEKNKFKNIAIELPESQNFGTEVFGFEGLSPVQDDVFFAKQVSTILNIASYHFDCFITQQACKLPTSYNVTLIADKSRTSNLKKGLQEGEIVSESVNSARHWIDMPAAHMHPQELSSIAKKIAKENNLKITVFEEKDIIKMGMGGLEAVSKGSDRDCALVIMEYKTTKKNAPTLAFVGKGITFDSGGLSLKPANSMETMKEDMSGAAAVIASMAAFAKLKPEVNIIAVAPISENLPSGKATKPGDIIKFYNGKTAEVRNTDAEGRLILADALSYTEKHYKPDIIIDLATLTGACQYALGHFYCGMMSKNKKLISRVQHASDLSGDRVWNLPFHDDYKVAIKSSVADISNTGNSKYMAGTITAGFFLQNFVENTPWLHLDIAGTAFDMPDVSYYRDGATGFGIRLLIELVQNWK